MSTCYEKLQHDCQVESLTIRRREKRKNQSSYKPVVRNTFFPRIDTLFFFPRSSRLSASDPVKDLGSRSPFRAPNSQKTAIKYDKLGCHTWGCSWALLGCFWASPGLLGLSASSLAAPAGSWLLLGLSWGDFAGTKGNHENDVPHDQLGRPNLSHSEFSGTRGGLCELEICNKNRTRQVSSNSKQ